MAGAAGGACSSETASPGGDGGSGGSSSGTGGEVVQPNCTDPAAVPCSDQVIQQMNLKVDPAPGLITNQAEGGGWLTFVDATAGGAFNPDPHSYVYGRFAEGGLEKVALGDEDSLDSMDWDIAFRRYVVRINSGNSGPSCVAAARTANGTLFEDVTVAPEGLTLRTDDYFTGSCELIPDGTGLESSPATALSAFWTYPGCVSMTGNVFVVALADGRQLKLQVTHYYEPTAQEQCDQSGTVPDPSGAANYRLRWAFLP
jgi:hypothetical protein